ncbi:uncharacterized protein LOC142355525 [Convolutriloba macropyga]|uniref:uncharacterized protein LOC142355525 n=1 Tax=Convolutriloba macropyga TaxID=536237 RepID=UPI003F51B5DC
MYLMLNFFYAALFAVVNLALEGAVTSTAANISVDDAEATNNITDITATCSSASHDCTNIFPSSTNTLASDPGWLIYTDLLPGHAYQITVNSSTYGGVADKLHLTTITFCTVPSFTTADFIVDALTSNSLSVDLSMNAAGIFDNGTLFVYDTTTRAELANFTFTYSQFPITLLDLPTSQSADLEFTFSVGSTTNCGVGGVQTSDVILYTYDGTGDGVKTVPMAALLLVSVLFSCRNLLTFF